MENSIAVRPFYLVKTIVPDSFPVSLLTLKPIIGLRAPLYFITKDCGFSDASSNQEFTRMLEMTAKLMD